MIYKTVEKWLSKFTDILITINDEDYEDAKKMKAKYVAKISGIGMEFNKYQPFQYYKIMLCFQFYSSHQPYVYS